MELCAGGCVGAGSRAAWERLIETAGVGGVHRWELWTNLMPYHGMSNVTVLAQVLSGGEVRPQVPGENGAAAIEPPSPQWEGLMRRCWSQVCTFAPRGLFVCSADQVTTVSFLGGLWASDASTSKGEF